MNGDVLHLLYKHVQFQVFTNAWECLGAGGPSSLGDILHFPCKGDDYSSMLPTDLEGSILTRHGS